MNRRGRHLCCALLLVITSAASLIGCAAPGAQRLVKPPKAMPPALKYVTADSLMIQIYNTDKRALVWKSSSLKSQPILGHIYAVVDTKSEDVAPWIGDHVGIATRQLDVPGTKGGTSLWFADVKDPAALKESLSSLSADGRAVKVYEDAVLVARSKTELDDFVRAASNYAVPDRRAMREYAAETAQKTPVGMIYRMDLLRTHLPRLVQEDPAMLEFARWATSSNVLLAARDGWIGVDGSRLVGNVEWVPRLAENVTWTKVASSDLDQLPDPEVDAALVIGDLGQHISEAITGITFGNNQYATPQKKLSGNKTVELEPLLDNLTGDATVTWNNKPRRLRFQLKGAATHANDVRQAFRAGGVDVDGYSTTTESDDLLISIPPQVSTPARASSQRSKDAQRAGRPPSDPVMWLWMQDVAGCAGPLAGWVTFDDEGEMSYSFAVQRIKGCEQLATRGFMWPREHN